MIFSGPFNFAKKSKKKTSGMIIFGVLMAMAGMYDGGSVCVFGPV